MSAVSGTPNQTTESLLLEALALDRELTAAKEMSRQRPGSLELVSRCNVLLGLMARDGRASTSEGFGRMAITRALLCKAATRLAVLESEADAVSRWIALACSQSADALNEAGTGPSHPVQCALNEIALCLGIVASLTVDDAHRVRPRQLLRNYLDRLAANAAVIAAEDELGVDALNEAVALDGLSRQMQLPSDRVACLDKASSSARIAAEHFGRVDNFEFLAKAEALVRQFTVLRDSQKQDPRPVNKPAEKPRAPAPASAGAQAPAPRFCGACGGGVQPDWKFCKACGAPLKPRTPVAPGGTH